MINTKIKLVVLGNSGVGKTSIINQYLTKEFKIDINSTIGASFNKKQIKIKDKFYDLEIWDTAGQEKYRSLTPIYYRGSDIVIIVYDITDIESFESAKKWLEIININLPKSIILLFGNKTDIISQRKVLKPDNNIFIKKYNKYIYVREGSAKKNDNIIESIQSLLYKFDDSELIYEEVSNPVNLYINDINNYKKNNQCC